MLNVESKQLKKGRESSDNLNLKCCKDKLSYSDNISQRVWGENGIGLLDVADCRDNRNPELLFASTK